MCMQSREHQYIFEPVCASVLLRRNASKEPLRSRHTPRIEGQVQLEPLSLHLSQVIHDTCCDAVVRCLTRIFNVFQGGKIFVLAVKFLYGLFSVNSIIQVQYQQIMAFLKELDRREKEMLFRKWRPKVPVSGKYGIIRTTKEFKQLR